MYQCCQQIAVLYELILLKALYHLQPQRGVNMAVDC